MMVLINLCIYSFGSVPYLFGAEDSETSISCYVQNLNELVYDAFVLISWSSYYGSGKPAQMHILFIDALWSPAGKGLTSLRAFVMSNCKVVTFPLVSWVRCAA